uniref:Uncharacterized protein n=1 Tax=Anguilla anguilla TaxID=7936 RepID=A0A0E9RF41_ANGAN
MFQSDEYLKMHFLTRMDWKSCLQFASLVK